MPPLPLYLQRGIADLLDFNRRGGVKIGWSVSTRLQPGQGCHHEPETGLVEACIPQAIAAVYVRQGVTLEVRRPRAVPYTAMDDPEHRLIPRRARSAVHAVLRRVRGDAQDRMSQSSLEKDR